ncbi:MULTISPECIES: M1 family metallopeptidase [unclassified Arenibacter]|uniref:M1 family metallopeptidase n=1 Tax=unclassified Arenibacter TaxID=2615047 RepID=UPI000E357CAB|nr:MULTISPECIES: M1 family metallopeptidase [unclassified Arenibacter]MCM4163083.1 peptidase M1 [Arenibacter sp. A80]RFT57116.1 M1 family peptidase [Arenibacter sp. P308M17]
MFAIGLTSYSQQKHFTEQDSLRGSITPERSWWDLNFYNLNVEVKPGEKFISGSNIIRYTVLQERQLLQVDLQPPLIIEKVTQDGITLQWESKGNAHFVSLRKPQRKGDVNEIKVYYSGHPKEAVQAPWDGGFSWKKDNSGKHFVATSCQGLGASVWWPNKDHMYDEVDSMAISITTPKDLMDVSNGRLLKVEENKDSKTYHWYVANPINNYGVNINLGDYVYFGETYNGEKGELTLDYYVLRDNEEKAKEQFRQAPMMMEAFEHWFGPYPFYKDGYKLVEVPYLGMEHQSSVTYGNQFGNGYLGNDLSKTGWGLKFDFILIHESGHEWFANNITYRDIADMWIHESFTAYSENLYLDYHFGKKAASEYVIGTRNNIQNDKPIIGIYDVNQKGSGDMYYKGANMLHTLRQLVDDDEKWRSILRGLNKEFYHQTVTTNQIEDFIGYSSGKDLAQFFDQYLRTVKIPILEYEVKDKQLHYRYTNIVDGFDMPLKINVNGTVDWFYPNASWKSKSFKKEILSVKVDNNFYVGQRKI